METPRAKASPFQKRMPASARRMVFIRQSTLFKQREAPVNPTVTEIDDPAGITEEIKTLVTDMGVNIVGIAAYDPNIRFADAEELNLTNVIVFAMTMAYDYMVDIGPNSQAEVHRVYHALDDIGVRLSQQIGAYGYNTRTQPNISDFPLPAYAWLAGLGELGKHGSLISPELGSSFRLGAVATDMPLIVDGPKDYGIDEVCSNCQICARFCPGEAITHDKKTVNGIERWHIDTPACEPYFFRMHGCKICLSVCPYNAKGIFKDKFKPMAKDIREAGDAKGMMKMISERTGIDYEALEYNPEDEGRDPNENS
jgi:Pyruvate/2-oxoacid:ferredoxin oxidoreductase delta subunit